jgi:hypothetical protein
VVKVKDSKFGKVVVEVFCNPYAFTVFFITSSVLNYKQPIIIQNVPASTTG